MSSKFSFEAIDSAVDPPANSSSSALLPKGCNCKNSRCLKLYCECFAAQGYCVNCNCKGCQNDFAHEAERKRAVEATLERNPKAFQPKINSSPASVQASPVHHAGCKCKKSGCLKKYCECYQAGIVCGQNCRCQECKNFEGSKERNNSILNETAGNPSATPSNSAPNSIQRPAVAPFQRSAIAAAAGAATGTNTGATRISQSAFNSSPTSSLPSPVGSAVHRSKSIESFSSVVPLGGLFTPQLINGFAQSLIQQAADAESKFNATHAITNGKIKSPAEQEAEAAAALSMLSGHNRVVAAVGSGRSSPNVGLVTPGSGPSPRHHGMAFSFPTSSSPSPNAQAAVAAALEAAMRNPVNSQTGSRKKLRSTDGSPIFMDRKAESHKSAEVSVSPKLEKSNKQTQSNAEEKEKLTNETPTTSESLSSSAGADSLSCSENFSVEQTKSSDHQKSSPSLLHQQETAVLHEFNGLLKRIIAVAQRREGDDDGINQNQNQQNNNNNSSTPAESASQQQSINSEELNNDIGNGNADDNMQVKSESKST